MVKIEQYKYQQPTVAAEHDDRPLVVHARPGKIPPNLVILIHGLRGHRYGYWGEMPRFLFEDIPDADVGLYYYRTALKRIHWFKSIDIEDEARVLADELHRLKFYSAITLIGHSMGGILAKAAIANLIERNFRQTLRKITGLVLLASPQIGSTRVPSWARLLSRDARALYPHGPLIKRIDTAFTTRLNLDQGSDPNDKSTVPTWAVIGAEDYWVDALSAGIGIPETQKCTIRADHSTVKSPTAKNEEAYSFIQSCLDSTFKPAKVREGEVVEMRVEDATFDQVQSIREIAVNFFGDEVTPEHSLLEFAKSRNILAVVKRVFITTEETRERVSGYFCLIPVGKSIAEEIRSGTLKGAQLSMAHVPKSESDTVALYIGAVAAKDYYSRAVVLEALRLRIKYAAALGIREFLTRPVTADGLRLTTKYGFRPLGTAKGVGELYFLEYPVGVVPW